MRLRVVLACLLALLVACAGSPTQEPEQAGDQGSAPPGTAAPEGSEPDADAGSEGASEGAAVGGDASAALEAVYAELEGLEGEERTARLVELAQAEEGELSFYTSMSLDNAGPITDAFDDAFDKGVSIYRATADTVAARYAQEVRAGFAGADVVSVNMAPITELDEQGLLLPLDTPTTDNLPESGVFDNWASTWLNVYLPAWNTNAVPPERAPKTWEDVLTFDGVVGWEPRDWDWLGTLVLDHFVAEQGMTEEEAIELFRQGGQKAEVVNGHIVLVEFLTAGQIELAASAYHHTTTQFMADGAPIDWQPAVQPLVALPDGIGIAVNTQRPASALLFIDFMMTEGQQVLADLGRTPASPNVEGGIPDDIEVINVNPDVLAERNKWEGIMQEIIGG